MRDQIIEGLIDADTIEQLLKESGLDLEKTISTCRAQEAAKKQRVEITSTSIREPVDVCAIRRQGQSQRPARLCPGCGNKLHDGGRQNCPAFNITCHTCKKIGHFARVCRGGKTQSATQPSSNLPETRAVSVMPFMASTQLSQSQVFDPAPTIKIQMSSLNGQAAVEALPDSGADISVGGPTLLKLLNEHQDNLLKSNVTPRAVNNTTMKPLGKLPITLKAGLHRYTDIFHIYPNVTTTLLSWKAARGLTILPKHYPKPAPTTTQPATPLKTTIPCLATTTSTQPTTPLDIQLEFPSVFDGHIKTMEGEMFHIALTKDAQPFCVNTPRTVPFAYRDKLQAELDLLQKQGIIAPVTEPTEWCSPIVVTPKKDSDKVRLCVDLSRLNRYVKRERYQSATPAQAVADMAAQSARVFTKLDALKGYHQCPLDPDSQLLTTFISPFGRFKFLRAPYGISSISEHYNRRMDEAFAGLTGYRRIVDDIVIYDNDPKQHADHVRQFLQRCSKQKITLNIDKWEYAKEQIKFAGFKLSAQGYSVDESVIKAITHFPTPTNRSDLRAFFGLANQLSASTATLANVLTPLRPLLSTKNDFLWTSEHDTAFTVTKEALSTAPTLSYFDTTKPTRMCTDASREGLGFVLQQKMKTSGPSFKQDLDFFLKQNPGTQS